MKQQLLYKIIPEAQEYEDTKYYFKDKLVQLKQLFKKKVSVDGVARVRVRRCKGFDQDGKPIYGDWKLIHKEKYNVFLNAARDALHAFMYTNAGNGGASFRWVALTNDTGQTVDATATSLTSEITANGLGRKDGVNAGTTTHSAGTNTTLMVILWTATGAQSAQRYMTFNAVTVGTGGHFNTFTATTLANTDQLELSITFTAG